MAAASASIALSCPKITSFRLRSRFFSTSRSEVETLLAGMRAMRATTSSMWRTSTVGSRSAIGFRRCAGAGLIDHVDGLVRQVALVDVARGELGGRRQGIVGIGDAVVLLEARLEPEEDLDGLGDRGLDDVDLLEAPRECVVLLEDAAVLVVGGRADAADLAVGEHRLDEVGGIHDPAGSGAGADHGVDLVDEQDRARAASSARVITPFRRFSKSPRYLVPAISAPMSSA